MIKILTVLFILSATTIMGCKSPEFPDLPPNPPAKQTTPITTPKPLTQNPTQTPTPPEVVLPAPRDPSNPPPIPNKLKETRLLIAGEQQIPGLSIPRLRLTTNQPLRIQAWLATTTAAGTNISPIDQDEISVKSHDPARISLPTSKTITATQAGYAKVTITWKDLTHTLMATAAGDPHATPPDIHELEIYPRIITLDAPGQTTQLDAQAYYPDGSTHQIPQDFPYPLVWRSSNPDVASIDQTGLLTSHSPGGASAFIHIGDIDNKNGNDVLIFGHSEITEAEQAPLCQVPVPGQEELSYNLNRMLIDTDENPITPHGGKAIASQTGGHWQTTKSWPIQHVIDYPCLGDTDEERLAHTNQLIIRLLETPGLLAASPEVIDTPTNPTHAIPTVRSTPSHNPTPIPQDLHAPTLPPNEVLSLELKPTRTTMAPGRSLSLPTALHLTSRHADGTTRQFQWNSEFTTTIEPVRPEITSPLRSNTHIQPGRQDENATTTWGGYAALDPTGILKVDPHAPLTSFNITVLKNGRFASHRIDVRGPKSQYSCPGNSTNLEVQWEGGTPTPDTLGWHTLAKYPEFNTTIVQVPCGNNPIQDALQLPGVTAAAHHRPTGNEDLIPQTQYQPGPHHGLTILEQGQTSVIDIQWAKYADGSLRRLTPDQRLRINLQPKPQNLIQIQRTQDTWVIKALQPGKTTITLTGTPTQSAKIAVVTTPSTATQHTTLDKPNAVELRMAPKDNRATFFSGEQVTLQLSVLNDDGSTTPLDPPNDLVAFEIRRHPDTPISPQGTIHLGKAKVTRFNTPDERRVTATYRGLTAETLITVKEPPPNPPRVNRDCTYSTDPTLKANTILISTWRDQKYFTITGQMEDLAITSAGTKHNPRKPAQRNHLLRFPCDSPEDLAHVWSTTYLAPPTKTIQLLTPAAARSNIQKLVLDTRGQTYLGETEDITVSFNHQDGSQRLATQQQILETRIESLHTHIVTMTGPTQYKTLRTGTAMLRATHQGHKSEVQIEVQNTSLDPQCRAWYETWNVGDSKTVEYASLNRVLLKLHKGHGQSVAQELAVLFGATLKPGFLGLEADPTYLTGTLTTTYSPLA